jgi:hypothetical protein
MLIAQDESRQPVGTVQLTIGQAHERLLRDRAGFPLQRCLHFAYPDEARTGFVRGTGFERSGPVARLEL